MKPSCLLPVLLFACVVLASGCGGSDYEGSLVAEADSSTNLRATATSLRNMLEAAVDSEDFETERDIMLESGTDLQLDAGNYPESDAKLVNRINTVYKQLPTLTKSEAQSVINDIEADLK